MPINRLEKRLPAEWEPQSGVQLTWPRSDGDWGAHYDEAEACFLRIALEITRASQALIVCQDSARLRPLLRRAGVNLERVVFADLPADDAWARDHAPITVLENGEPVLLDFTFNGWGGKYPSDRDNRIPRQLHKLGVFNECEMRHINFVLEGGAIESDGEGTILTTASCMLSPGRNGGMDRTLIEQRLGEYLGAKRVLWLEHGHLAGDDTDGHIDTLARFCDGGTIVYTGCGKPDDEHYEPLLRLQHELRALVTTEGEPYTLVELPLPAPVYDESGQRLPATYANFLIMNDALLVPVYGAPEDAAALEILEECFPHRKLTPIDCVPLSRQRGALHCVTMQFPRGVLA